MQGSRGKPEENRESKGSPEKSKEVQEDTAPGEVEEAKEPTGSRGIYGSQGKPLEANGRPGTKATKEAEKAKEP